jgi:hypothetical protein
VFETDKNKLAVQNVKAAQALTLEQAQDKLAEAIYPVTKLLEELEAAGKLNYVGYTMRLDIVAFTKTYLRDGWK